MKWVHLHHWCCSVLAQCSCSFANFHRETMPRSLDAFGLHSHITRNRLADRFMCVGHVRGLNGNSPSNPCIRNHIVVNKECNGTGENWNNNNAMRSDSLVIGLDGKCCACALCIPSKIWIVHNVTTQKCYFWASFSRCTFHHRSASSNGSNNNNRCILQISIKFCADAHCNPLSFFNFN